MAVRGVAALPRQQRGPVLLVDADGVRLND